MARCPHCGEDDVITLNHRDMAQHQPDCPRSHAYCRNCDYGLCCGEC